MIDLHTHTNVSDGLLTPRELITLAVAYGLKAIAITDHDSVGAYSPELMTYARTEGIELVPGIELSAVSEDRQGYHIIGLFIDAMNPALLTTLNRLQSGRRAYTKKAIAALEQEGFRVEEAEVREGVITRAHIARGVLRHPGNHERLLREFGKIPSWGAFIESYMLAGQKCFVDREEDIAPADAIELIHAAGGLAFLAHPAIYVYKNGEKLSDLCDKFRQWGIDGFESYNIQYDRSNGDQEVDMSADFAAYCKEFGLLESGGSDFHTNDENAIGKVIDLGFKNNGMKVPDVLLGKMKDVLNTKSPRKDRKY